MESQRINEINQRQFSQLLYSSFRDKKESWIMNNYLIDHEAKLLKPGIDQQMVDYYQLESHLFYKSGQIVSGMTFNLNSSNKFQIEVIGFNIPDEVKRSSCEILNFFILHHPRTSPFWLGKQVEKVERGLLKKESLSTIFATCSVRLLNFYFRFGWKPIDEIDWKNNRKLYLIQYSL